MARTVSRIRGLRFRAGVAVAAALDYLSLAAPAWSQTISVDPRSSYLHRSNDPNAPDAVPLDLASLESSREIRSGSSAWEVSSPPWTPQELCPSMGLARQPVQACFGVTRRREAAK